jgi:hypothetical protein
MIQIKQQGQQGFMSSLLAHPGDVFVEVGAGAIVPSEFLIESAAQVADVALGADEENGHLQRAALDDYEADDVAFLFGHGLVGQVLSVLLLEGGEELGMLTVNLAAEGLPLLGRRVGIL